MDYKRDAFLMIDPVTGATKLVEQPKEPEQIVEAFLKEAKKPNSLLWALDELAYKDWQKWDSARQKFQKTVMNAIKQVISESTRYKNYANWSDAAKRNAEIAIMRNLVKENL